MSYPDKIDPETPQTVAQSHADRTKYWLRTIRWSINIDLLTQNKNQEQIIEEDQPKSLTKVKWKDEYRSKNEWYSDDDRSNKDQQTSI